MAKLDAQREPDDLRERIEHYRELSEQLQYALDSRVAIEQAKGVLAERYQLDFDEAFRLLRFYCRTHNLKIIDAARALTDKEARLSA